MQTILICPLGASGKLRGRRFKTILTLYFHESESSLVHGILLKQNVLQMAFPLQCLKSSLTYRQTQQEKRTLFIWKAYALAVNLGYLEKFIVHPTRRQSFAGKLHLVLRNI